ASTPPTEPSRAPSPSGVLCFFRSMVHTLMGALFLVFKELLGGDRIESIHRHRAEKKWPYCCPSCWLAYSPATQSPDICLSADGQTQVWYPMNWAPLGCSV
ncbi:mCG146001, partial [Mus musculus]